MDGIKKFLQTSAIYFKKDSKDLPQQDKEKEAENLEGRSKARQKPSGSGLSRMVTISVIGIIALAAGYLILFGLGRPGNKLATTEEKERPVQAASGSHLKNIPADYTAEAKKEETAGAKENAGKLTKEKATQPRPTLPRQPQAQRQSRLTAEEKERLEEYKVLLKAYQSPIRFELKE